MKLIVSRRQKIVTSCLQNASASWAEFIILVSAVVDYFALMPRTTCYHNPTPRESAPL
jgi:hypothetical protein